MDDGRINPPRTLTFEEAKKFANALNEDICVAVNWMILENASPKIDSEISDELSAFLRDCEVNGVRFHRCGFAMIEDELGMANCYMCRKLLCRK